VYAHPGHQTSVTLTAQNEVPVAGFEFKVQSVDSESSPLAPIALEDEQPSSHVQPEGAINHLESDGFSVFETTDEAGVSTFIVVAIGGDTIEPGEHTVLELVYTVAEESEALDLPHVIDVVMTDVVVSSPDAQSILTSVQNGSITIGVQGDVSGGEFGTGDGEINVLDIVQVINYILEVVPLPEDPFSLWVLDMNDDGDINVLDLQLLINSFLGIEPVVTRPMVATPSVATLQSEPTTDQAHPFVLIDLDLSEDIAGFQAVLQFDPKSIQPGVPTLDESVSGLQLNYAVKDGRLSLLVYSLDGGQIDSGIDGLVRVPVTVVGGEGEIRLSEMILSNAAGQAIPSRISETTLKLADVPSEFALGPNAPNPFNPQTSISYEVPVQTRVLLVVYNLLGQEVTRLVDQIQPAGRYSVVWDARNGQGVQVASGVYMYRLITDSGRTESRRMMLLK
ncbi:MAG: T9SS type A sorting domain-containing protein, partial [Candidatus Latescibacteria bacterium]|nr:T9SS type A sorting domain-containing protein [Candidatus Latescibacterota bacterium]